MSDDNDTTAGSSRIEEQVWVFQEVYNGVVETPGVYRSEQEATALFCQRAEARGFIRQPGESDDDMYSAFTICDLIARGQEIPITDAYKALEVRARESKFDFQDDELHLWCLPLR